LFYGGISPRAEIFIALNVNDTIIFIVRGNTARKVARRFRVAAPQHSNLHKQKDEHIAIRGNTMNKKITSLILGAAVLSLPAFAAENVAPGETDALAKLRKDMPEYPVAPAEYRRPEGYEPHLYNLNLQQISNVYSQQTTAYAKEYCNKVKDVNDNGKWKPTGKSIDAHKCPEWFQDAKFGIFVDWGLWSIASWAPKREKGAMYPDWYEMRMYTEYNPKMPFAAFRPYHIKNWGADFQRDHFIPLFKAEKFDAAKLVNIFKDCGAKYVVPFDKHHSGFCLWPSSFTLRDTADMGPRRDIVSEFVEQCARHNLKFGFYFSVREWEYPVLLENGEIAKYEWSGKVTPYTPDMEYKASGKIAVKDYVKDYMIPQAAEFIDKYNPDLIWYDGEWGVPAVDIGTYDVAAYFYNVNEGKKGVAVNDRWGNGESEELVGKFTKEKPRKWLRTVRGDFYTNEYGDTAECLDPAKYHPWEACRGISQSFGNNWQDNESNVISSKEFIIMFADMVAHGGNLLLIVNLDGQGEIPEIQKARLLDIGAWLKKYGEAIYSTRIIAPFSTADVAYTRSKDSSIGYAIVKNLAPEVLVELSLPEGAKVVDIASGRELSWRYKDAANPKAGAVVALADLAASPLPIALRCNLR